MERINREGFRAWNIPAGWAKGRSSGLSAAVRVRNEDQWLEASVDSIVKWVDEIVIAIQGEQSDGTLDVARRLKEKYPYQVRVLEFPFCSHPNGPGHDEVPGESVYARAYFYNWCLAQTSLSHVVKWDGDMVAFDWLGDRIRNVMWKFPSVWFRGIDICGEALKHTSRSEFTADEPRVFKVTEETYWTPGPFSEAFSGRFLASLRLEDPGYLHFKWAKDFSSAVKAWPESWEDHPHFAKIIESKREKGTIYEGEWPSVLLETARG